LNTTVQKGLQCLDHFLECKRLSELSNFEAETTSQLRGKLQVWSLLQQKASKVEGEIASAKEDKIRRMKESEFARVGKEQETKGQDIQRRTDADILSRRVAAGLIEVRAT